MNQLHQGQNWCITRFLHYSVCIIAISTVCHWQAVDADCLWPQTKDIADGHTCLLIIDGHSSWIMLPLMISLLFASHHTQPMLSKMQCWCAWYCTIQALLCTGTVHDDGFGAMNKCALLQSKSYSPRHLLWRASRNHLNLLVCTHSIAVQSRLQRWPPVFQSPPTLFPLLMSPVQSRQWRLHLQTFLMIHTCSSLLPSAPSWACLMFLNSCPTSYAFYYSTTVPKANTSEPLPQKLAQTLLQGTLAACIVSDNPVTTSVVFKPYCTPSAPSINSTCHPHTSPLHNPLELTAENAALCEYIDRLNHVIASQHVQLTLSIMAVWKLKDQLYEEEQSMKERKGHHLLHGKAQIAITP